MMGDRQSQKSGDSSTNYQAQRDIVISGPSYAEVEQIAMTVFKANFLELGDKAAEHAFERAQEFVDALLKKAAEEGQTEIPEAENPDFQYALYSAQKEYARTGDKDLGELLVQLLIDRTKVTDRNLTQIVLNESLEVASKLPPDQYDALSLVFILRYASFISLRSLDELFEALDKFVLPFVAGASRKDSAYRHLEYAGCGAISLSKLDAHAPFSSNYPGLLCEGFTEEELLQTQELTAEQRSELVIPCLYNDALLQVDALNDKGTDDLCEQLGIEAEGVEKLKQLQRQKMMHPEKIRSYLIDARPQMRDLFELWDNTVINILTLTSVGIAVAHANIKKQTGESFDLSDWM